MKHTFPLRKVYGPPMLLAVVTIGGLISALLGDGVWDVISWGALIIPLAVITQKLWSR
jgi:hypothetical protein